MLVASGTPVAAVMLRLSDQIYAQTSRIIWSRWLRIGKIFNVISGCRIEFILCWTGVLERRENIRNIGQRRTGIVCVCSVRLGFVWRRAKVAAVGDPASSSLKLS